MIRIDRQRTAADLLPAINRLFDLSAQKIRSIEESLASRRRIAGVHRRRRVPIARLDGVDAGLSVRRAAAAVRCDLRSRVSRARPLAHARAHGAAPDARRRARSRLQQRQHLRQPVAARARRQVRGRGVGAALLRACAEGDRRRAGSPLDADSATAGSSTPSTARTRCSSTRSARCARWRSRTCLAIGCSKSRTCR